MRLAVVLLATIVVLGVSASELEAVPALTAGGGDWMFLKFYNTGNCTGKPSNVDKIPQGECYRGQSSQCSKINTKCVEYQAYSTKDCVNGPNNNLNGPNSVRCGVCQSYLIPSNSTNYPRGYGIFRNCDNNGATYHYDCDSKCASCKTSVMTPTGSCTPSPAGGYNYIKKSTVCHSLVTNLRCDGSNWNEEFLGNQCFGDGKGSSQLYYCPQI